MKQELSLTCRLRIPDGILSHDLQGELVILDLKTGVYFGLDPIGTRIWHLLQAHQSLQKVLDSLVEEYEVTEGACAHDLLGFVAKMLERGLVEVNNKADT
jgi:hypothetical protein